MVDVEGLGTFETYANKDVNRYVRFFDLPEDVTFYRGLLRFSGYCNNMRNFIKLDLLNDQESLDFADTTFREFAAKLVGVVPDEQLEDNFAKFLNADHLSDIMLRLKWLGLFSAERIRIEQGTRLDAFIELLLKKMSYAPGETDMTIIHVEIVSELPDGTRDKRMATMVKHGEPDGDSAMAKAVGLPPAIAVNHIFEGKIPEIGVQLPPSLPYLYKPFMQELEKHGFHFVKRHKASKLLMADSGSHRQGVTST